VVGELDGEGNVLVSRKYDVFGSVRESTGAGVSDHKFVGSLGHVSEDETGLIYMRARYMDPALGRFISEDPARDGANWFVYCRNNPVGNVDTDGKVVAPAIGAAILALGVGASTYLGIGVGYMLAVSYIQHEWDPNYKASPNWFARGAVSFAAGAIGFMSSPRGALWGKGIGAAALASGMAPWMAVAFIIGVEAGMIEAFLDYDMVQDNLMNHQ